MGDDGTHARAAPSVVACPAQSVSYANADPLLIVGGRGARLVDVRAAASSTRAIMSRTSATRAPARRRAVAAAMTAPCTNTRYLHPNHAALCKRLLETMPAPLDRGHVFLVNSGSEANDLALRLCRAWARRRHGGDCGVVVLHARLPRPHGRVHRPVALQARARDLQRPRPTALGRGRRRARRLPGRRPRRRRRGGVARGWKRAGSGSARSSSRAARPSPACGSRPSFLAAKAFEAVRRRAASSSRTRSRRASGGSSSWYAFEAHGVAPDVVTVGKLFGNGLPLAAAVVARAVSDAFAAGPEYFNTFGGNPACCAAGLAVLEAIEADGLARTRRAWRGTRKGFERLMGLGGARCVVGDVRGRGLFLGVDLVRTRPRRRRRRPRPPGSAPGS